MFGCIFLSVAASVAAAAAASSTARPSPTTPLSPRFQQVRDRIDALFRHRLDPPPPVDPRLSPFRPPGSVLTSRPPGNPGSTATPMPEPLASDLALLQQSVAALKVGGMLEADGQYHLVINGKAYKKGDMVQVAVQDTSVYLRVRDIMRHSVTFALNDTEITLKF